MDDVLDLFNAVGRGDDTAVSRVIAQRPDLARARDAATLSVLQFARYMQRDEILRALVAAGPPLDTFEAAMLDDEASLERILAADPTQLGAYSSDGFTPLHLAAYFGGTAAMRILLDAGAGTEAVTRNFLTNMPLHAAAAGGRVEACELLLEYGADVNAIQHGAHTPLHTPAFTNNRAMAELFLAHGADSQAKNDDGKTASDIASGMGNLELAALLRVHESK